MNISLRTFIKYLVSWAAVLAFCQLGMAQGSGYYTPYSIITNTTFEYDDPYSNVLGYSVNDNPSNGTVTTPSQNGTDFIIYTPNTNFEGKDTFSVTIVVFNFPAGFEAYNLGFEINVIPSVVIAHNDYAMQLSPISIIEIPVLANDSTSTGNLTISNISVINNGSATITPDSTKINFTPDLNYVGITYLLYTACDENDQCDQGMLTIRMTDYTPPDSDTTFLITTENTSIPVVLPAIGFDELNAPANGTLTQLSDFVYMYDPDASFTGVDSFSFDLNHNNGYSTAQVYVTVLNAPAPNQFAMEDYAYLVVNQDSIVVDVLANDMSMASLSIPSLNVSTQPVNGTAYKSGDKIVYIPNNGFSGVDIFYYKIANVFGVTEYAPIYCIVSNHYPAFYTFDLTTPVNTPLVLNYEVPISGYDFNIVDDPDYGVVEYYPGDTTLTIHGQTVSGYNLLIYYPEEDFYTTDSSEIDEIEIEYCIDGNCPTAKLDIWIQEMPNAPVDTFCIGKKCVWAGDTNNDGIVDIKDVLPIGLGMGENGVPRVNASTDWYGQYSEEWDPAPTVLEPKYYDTDGDGLVTTDDTAAISQHYLKTHNLLPEETPVALPLLFFDIVSPSGPIDSGDVVIIEVSLGSEAYPSFDAYGLSFLFNFNTDFIDPQTVDFQAYENSWLSFYSPMLSMAKQPFESRLDVGLTRTNGISASGYGAVGQISFIITEDFAGFRYNKQGVIQVEVTGGQSMNGFGHYAKLNDEIIEIPFDFTQKPQPFREDMVVTYPNPADDFVNIHLNGSDNTIEDVIVYTVDGREVMRMMDVNQRHLRLDVSTFETGLYIFDIMTQDGPAPKKIQISRY